MFDNIRKAFGGKERHKVYTNVDGRRYLGGGASTPTLTFYKGRAHDNAYPNISRITNAFMTIRPYAIDSNGKPVEDVAALNAIYRPNQQMSAVDFREALAVMTLVHRKVYLAVWHRENGQSVLGGKITPENISGFTFLEGVTEIVGDGVKRYLVDGKTYTENEVIEIYSGVDPYNLGKGYSPSVAANKWANLDDYIAAYEAGLFENGAVPAGQFIITAPSVAQFNDIVDEMERKHRGSGRNNNVIYTHRPVSEETGLPVEAQVQWIPFAQSNKDMNIGSLFEQANKKLDNAFGVPDEIKGFLKNSNYASVAVAERIFLKYTVDPLALKIWTRFTFELNRITGGLGYAITHKIDIPNLADEDKVTSETKSVEGDIILKMTNAGYSLDSVVDAFELSNSYKVLQLKQNGRDSAEIRNDKPEVDDGGEVEAAPDFTNVEQSKKSKCSHKDKSIEATDVIEAVAIIIREHMRQQAEVAISEDVDDETEDDRSEVVAKLMVVLMAYMLTEGQINYKEGLRIIASAGIPVGGATKFAIDELVRAKYHDYLTNIMRSYDDDTAASIRGILARAQAEAWDKETIARNIREAVDAEEWRVQRIARTEVHRCGGQASVESMRQLMYETNTKIYKVWHTNGAGCEFCRAMDGKKELVTNSFVVKGDKLSGSDGGTLMNDFADIDTASMHPNCSCYVTYEVES